MSINQNIINMKSVTVIIPTYHDWNGAAKCIECLKAQTYPFSEIEIIIVNNDPSDQCPFSDIPKNVKILKESKAGSYAARNTGLKVAEGEIVAFTDSDCLPAVDWIIKGVECFIKNPNISRIGGKISLFYQNKQLNAAEIYEKALGFRQKEFVENIHMAATANMMTYKAVFDEVGFFNSELLSGGDTEWGLRAEKQGFKIIYASDCVVYHPSRNKLSELIQKAKREAGGHFQVYSSNKIYLIVSLLMGLIPPFKALLHMCKNIELSTKEIIIAFFLRYYLRIISTKEKILLILHLKDRERR